MRMGILGKWSLMILASTVIGGWAADPSQTDRGQTGPAPGAIGPKLVVSEQNWEFGDVPNVGKVSHTFRLSNAGDTALTIANVQGSCGCTSTRIQNKEMKPGDTTEVTVAFNSAAYPTGGAFIKTVSVYLVEVGAPAKTFSISATVDTGDYGYVSLAPKFLEVSPEDNGRDTWKSMRITNRSALTQHLQVLETAGLAKAVKLSRTQLAPGEEARIRVRISPGKTDALASSFTLALVSQEGERRFSVPIVPLTKTKPQVGTTPQRNTSSH